MDINQVVIWIVIGGIAGLLADAVVKGVRIGLVGAIVVGILGAVIGGWLMGLLDLNIGGGVLKRHHRCLHRGMSPAARPARLETNLILHTAPGTIVFWKN